VSDHKPLKNKHQQSTSTSTSTIVSTPKININNNININTNNQHQQRKSTATIVSTLPASTFALVFNSQQFSTIHSVQFSNPVSFLHQC